MIDVFADIGAENDEEEGAEDSGGKTQLNM